MYSVTLILLRFSTGSSITSISSKICVSILQQLLHISLSVRAVILYCISQAIIVKRKDSKFGRSFIPRTSVFVSIFQTLKVSTTGSSTACLLIPRISLLVSISQTIEVTTTSSIIACFTIQRASVFVSIF
mmetsp:Transcript_32047/g.54050  ORF Transcript_32047/g.54050 Transcript_32047/m.54050 type:complete len:130 (-) Transcript_32047:128-517(-)